MSDRENYEIEESPRKKRKVTSTLSKEKRSGQSHPTARSTPRPSVLNEQQQVRVSSSIETSSFVEASFIVPLTPALRRNLNYAERARTESTESAAESHSESESKENKKPEKTLVDFLDSSLSSLVESSLYSEDEDVLNYDDFFIKCRRILLKGAIWQLYKPITDDKASLYYQITTDPRNAEVLAKWFSEYCRTKPTYVGTIYLHQFYFDCAGYQKYNIRKGNEFKFPINVNTIIAKLNDVEFTNSVLTSTKFLFSEKARLAKILKYAIYNFIQKFVISLQELLTGSIINSFIELLISVCKQCEFIPLVYTAFIFVMKILTGLCILKKNISRDDKYLVKVDDLITKLYLTFIIMRSQNDYRFISLKLAALNELKLWIQYYPNIFLNHFNCVDYLKYLIVNESRTVRLATLDFCMKIIQSDEFAPYLSHATINELSRKIWGRTSDADESVALKAFEVYTEMIKSFQEYVCRDGVNEKLVQTIFHKDFRMGSAAGKCIYQFMLKEANDSMTRLKLYCKMCNFHPKLKAALVESLIDHDPILQEWELYVQILINPNDYNFPVTRMVVLTELVLEAAHVSLTGCTTKKRFQSKTMRSIHYNNNDLLANAFYGNLNEIVSVHYKEKDIMTNIFKILMKVSPDYLKEEHLEIAAELVEKLIPTLFIKFKDNNSLSTIMDYLIYMQLEANAAASAAIDNLKDFVCLKLNEFLDEANIEKAKCFALKYAVLFSKIDLTEKMEWTKLLNSWQYASTDDEFVEYVLAACHWNLIWTIRSVRINSRTEKTDIPKIVLAIKKRFSQYFSVCDEAFKSENQSVRLKAFERICESYIKFALEVENVSKQTRDFEVLKPSMLDDIVSRSQLLMYFEGNVEASLNDDAARTRFCKFILSIYQMACLEILPVDSISVIFKYYDKYQNQYGTVIETILTNIFNKNENWLPMLVVNTLSLCYEDVLHKYGVVDYMSHEAKQISRLALRLHEFKNIFKAPKSAAMLLIYAINYAAQNKYYDFFIYLRVFIEDVQQYPADVESILNTVKEKVPQADTKNDAVLYFVDQLKKATKKPTTVKKVVPRKAPKYPKLKPQKKEPTKTKKKQTTKTQSEPKKPKSKAKPSKKLSQQSTETEDSENMSIHDSSDNLMESSDME
ncbi:uncharacterized protein LOC126745179 [Anthonomus grandis grandis]|uniref:uncharacterized protein LOC126745179 n=1 Tax=Anthonomus grandis grandis TaxID=2921223 RepID=UPI002166306B|nr:uncharacterized protein LOC126745179 [Anthonomus grandis grandis]XP_050308864.1 uncharacterized protein LOC126745179 [Anthonomus grandis grandis]